MAAKTVRVSNDDTTYFVIPGNSADLSEDLATVDDSIFGTTFSSTQATLKTWTLSSGAMFKGIPGYVATLKKAGSPTSFTDAETEELDGVHYITNRSQSLLDRTVSVTVNDAGTVVDEADIDYIDYLQGGVKFSSNYTPSGDITISGSYLPLAAICYAQTFSLSQSADTQNVTDLCEAQENGGHGVFSYQQQSVELSLDGFYNDASEFSDDLDSRDTFVIEISPAGDDSSVARGYFMCTSRSQSGGVGETETESATYTLQVPEGVERPFSWYHSNTTTIPQAVKVIIDAWEDREELWIEYTPEGSSTTRKGKVLVSDASLDGGVEDMNEFSLDFQGTGQLEKIVA